MKKKYVVELKDTEREELRGCVSKGQSPAYQIRRAPILLKSETAGPGWSDKQIAEAFGCHPQTVYNVRRRFAEEGVSGALGRRSREAPPRQRRLDGAGEARLIALRCGQPPEGYGRWTLRLLVSNKLVELQIVEGISPETVRQTLKKTR